MGDTGSLWYLRREHYSYMIFGGSLVLVPLVKKKQFFYESLMEPRLASTVDKDNLELGILHLHLPGDRICHTWTGILELSARTVTTELRSQPTRRCGEEETEPDSG